MGSTRQDSGISWLGWVAGGFGIYGAVSRWMRPSHPNGACPQFAGASALDAFIDTFVDYSVSRQIFQASPASTKPPEWKFPAAKRLVAIGDLHGDLPKTRTALRIGGLIDENDHWIGGTTVAVQVGDQLDRGPNEIAICLLMERLRQEAEKAGGKFVSMNGNHETMNAKGDFRYARQGYDEFTYWKKMYLLGQRWKRNCGLPQQPLPTAPEGVASHKVARWQGIQCGGPITKRFLAPQPTIVMVGKTLFAHGGVLPEHIEAGVDEINREVWEWLSLPVGERTPPVCVNGRNSIVWSRHFGHENGFECECDLLTQMLNKASAARLIVGHTIQDAGINSACNGTVIRVDVGMSNGCGGANPEVLEVIDDEIMHVLKH